MSSIKYLILFITLCFANPRINAAGDFFGNGFNSKMPKTKTPVLEDDYYKTIGVAKGATDQEIKKAYRQKARLIHPDKGGDEEKFKKLGEAYEVLSDPKKREAYDRYGKAGAIPQNGYSYPQNPDFGRDIFREFSMFSMPLTAYLDVSLEDLYRGREVTLTLDGMAKPLKINIARGMMDGHEFIRRGVVGGGDRRDLIIKLRERSHKKFTRKNADLQISVEITPQESLFGFNRTIRHLDGVDFVIHTSEGSITPHNAMLAVDGLGMPVFINQNRGSTLFKRGNLYVRVSCKWPDRMWLKGRDEVALYDLLATAKTQLGLKSTARRPTPAYIADNGDRFAGVNDERGMGETVKDIWRSASNAWKRKPIGVEQTGDVQSRYRQVSVDSGARHKANDKGSGFTLRKADPSEFGAIGADPKASTNGNNMDNIFSQFFFR